VEVPKKEVSEPLPRADVSVELPENQEKSEFNWENVNPAEDWPCWTEYDSSDSECKECPFKADCSKEAGVPL